MRSKAFWRAWWIRRRATSWCGSSDWPPWMRNWAGWSRRLAKLDDDLAEAEQACERCRSAATELAAFSDAGITDLHRASRDFRNWQDAGNAATELAENLSRVLQSAVSFDAPDIDDLAEQVLGAAGVSERGDEFRERFETGP